MPPPDHGCRSRARRTARRLGGESISLATAGPDRRNREIGHFTVALGMRDLGRRGRRSERAVAATTRRQPVQFSLCLEILALTRIRPSVTNAATTDEELGVCINPEALNLHKIRHG